MILTYSLPDMYRSRSRLLQKRSKSSRHVCHAKAHNYSAWQETEWLSKTCRTLNAVVITKMSIVIPVKPVRSPVS